MTSTNTQEDAIEELKSRLLNWKFEQALQYGEALKKEESKEISLLLNRLFGNPGWIEGDMGEIASCLVNYIYLLEGWEMEE